MAHLMKLPTLASRWERTNRLMAIISQLSSEQFDALWDFVITLARKGTAH